MLVQMFRQKPDQVGRQQQRCFCFCRWDWNHGRIIPPWCSYLSTVISCLVYVLHWQHSAPPISCAPMISRILASSRPHLNSPIGPRARRRWSKRRRGEERRERRVETWAPSVLIISTDLKTSSGQRRSTRTLRWRSRRSALPMRRGGGGVSLRLFVNPPPSPSLLSGVSSNGLHVQPMSAWTCRGTFALGGCCCCNHQEDLEQHRRPACALWRSALNRASLTEIWNLK